MNGETYEEFIEKFKPKKTTDDCYTPPEVYEVVKGWACQQYDIDPKSIVRPFFSGGDYENAEYPAGCTVLDNPPFSILSKICEFYVEHNIKFFLFAPTLTCFSGVKVFDKMNHIICGASVVYENGAAVNTSFVTNYDTGIVAQTAPELRKRIDDAVLKLRCDRVKQLPKYEYPDYIVTAAMMQRWAGHGVDFVVRRGEYRHVRQLDAQKADKKVIFGSGLLLSERAATVRAAAERAAAERAAATRYKLSNRELALVRELSNRG